MAGIINYDIKLKSKKGVRKKKGWTSFIDESEADTWCAPLFAVFVLILTSPTVPTETHCLLDSWRHWDWFVPGRNCATYGFLAVHFYHHLVEKDVGIFVWSH
jgi:hypothetical protein